MKIFTCEKCFKPFQRRTIRRVYRFCSQYCANKHALKLGHDELLPYAEIGARVAHIAKRLEVAEHTVRDALRRHGLFKLWYSVRYNRCVSPKAGNSSAPIASSETTSPSAATAPLMAGGMSCGN